MEEVKPEQLADRKKRSWVPSMFHFGFGGSVAAAAMTLTPLKGYFFTREEGKATIEQIADLKHTVELGFAEQNKIFLAHVSDEAHSSEHSNDVMRQRIVDEKTDRLHDSDQLNKRIDLVMELFRIKTSKTN